MSCIGQKHLSKEVQYFEEAFRQTTCVLDLNFNFKQWSNISLFGKNLSFTFKVYMFSKKALKKERHCESFHTLKPRGFQWEKDELQESKLLNRRHAWHNTSLDNPPF